MPEIYRNNNGTAQLVMGAGGLDPAYVNKINAAEANAAQVPDIVGRVEELEANQAALGERVGEGEGTNTGFTLADGTDLAEIFLNAADVTLTSGGSGSFLTGLSLDTSVSGKAAFSMTRGNATYCTYCTYCAGHCSYCHYCGYCTYCTYCASSNCSNCSSSNN